VLVAVFSVALVALVALLSAGCGGGGDTSDSHGTDSLTQASQVPGSSGVTGGDEAGEPAQRQETRMDIHITIGDQTFGATLQNSPATRDLVAQLPATVAMIDHGGVEKTGPLPRPLSLEGQPEGADPDVGDVGYYAPGNDLVLYYGDQSYFPGIVVLGRLNGDAAERIADMDGPVTATVEAR
jgi:hypothetical protein